MSWVATSVLLPIWIYFQLDLIIKILQLFLQTARWLMLIRSEMWIRFNGHAKIGLLTVTNDLKSTVTAPVVTAWTNWRRIADQVLLDALRTNLRAGLRLSFLLLKHLQLLYLKQFLGHQRRRFCGSFILVFSSEVWHLPKLWCTSVASLVICSVEEWGCFILNHFLGWLL